MLKRFIRIVMFNALIIAVIAFCGCGNDKKAASIVFTSDLNGDASLIGKASALRDSLEEDVATYLIDCGNTISASAESAASNGKSIADLMTVADYDAAILSSKDVDYTGDLLIPNSLEFNYLANDLRKLSDNSILCSTRISKINDIKTGLLGITNSKGNDLFSKVTGEELYKILNDYTAHFEIEECDLVILTVSEGDKSLCEELAAKVKNIDVIISTGADTNSTEDSNDVFIVCKAVNNNEAGVITCDDGNYEVEYKSLNDYEVSTEFASAIASNSEGSKKLADCSQSLSGDSIKAETALGDLVAQAVNNTLDTEGTLVDGSLITSALNSGDITCNDLLSSVKDSTIVKVKLTGEELLSIVQDYVEKQSIVLQSCGIVYTINTTVTPNIVRIVSVNNELFNSKDEYTVTTCLPDYDYGKLTVNSVSATLHTALYKYVSEVLDGKIDETYAKTDGMITYVSVSDVKKGPETIGLYRHDKSTHIRYLVDNIQGVFTTGQNVASFDSIAGSEESYAWSDYKAEYRKLFYSSKDSEQFKIGYKIKFKLEDGTEFNYIITKPDDTEAFFEYIEAYIYDDINQPDGAWYSHLTSDQMTDQTLMTSIKLHGGAKIGKVNEIWLTNFIYSNDKDFNKDSGDYIGSLSYMIDIYK